MVHGYYASVHSDGTGESDSRLTTKHFQKMFFKFKCLNEMWLTVRENSTAKMFLINE